MRELIAFSTLQSGGGQYIPEYKFPSQLLPEGSFAANDAADEAAYISAFIDSAELENTTRICIDITGVLAPYLLFLLRALAHRGVSTVEVLYAEPGQYLESEETKFSGEDVRGVRQVYGFEGSHITNTSKDLLVVGAGYDHQLLKMIATAKEGARAIELFGMPALRADMYQQNILRASRAAASEDVLLKLMVLYWNSRSQFAQLRCEKFNLRLVPVVCFYRK